MKPKKIIYKNQEEIKQKFLKYIKPFFKKYPIIEEAFLFGSLTNKTFGKYESEYKGHTGSDIDLVVFIDGKIPTNWKNLESTNPDFELYKDNEFRRFMYKNNPHKIDIIVPHKKNLKEDYIKIK